MRALVSVLFVCCMGLTLLVLVDSGAHFEEASLLHRLELVRTEGLSLWMIALTTLGGHHVMVPVCTILVVLVAWRDRRSGAFLALAWVGSAATNALVKILVGRARPSVEDALTSPPGLSFPSGHSQATMAFALALALMLFRSNTVPLRRSVWLLLFPLAIGITRAYLGVHYPTDILAGWCFGAFAVLLTHQAFPQQVSARSGF